MVDRAVDLPRLPPWSSRQIPSADGYRQPDPRHGPRASSTWVSSRSSPFSFRKVAGREITSCRGDSQILEEAALSGGRFTLMCTSRSGAPAPDPGRHGSVETVSPSSPRSTSPLARSSFSRSPMPRWSRSRTGRFAAGRSVPSAPGPGSSGAPATRSCSRWSGGSCGREAVRRTRRSGCSVSSSSGAAAAEPHRWLIRIPAARSPPWPMPGRGPGSGTRRCGLQPADDRDLHPGDRLVVRHRPLPAVDAAGRAR